MSYNRKTPLLGIPVPKAERLRSDVEYRKFCLIENQLVAGTGGVRYAVFSDGNYQVEIDADDEKCFVRLVGTGRTPSAHGIASGAYFRADDALVWSGLKRGKKYFLYLRSNSKTMFDFSDIRTVSSPFELEDKTALLMAFVDLRDEPYSLDPYPDGKVYSSDVALHTNDRKNPHGRQLFQDEVFIGKRLVLEDGATFEIGQIANVSDFKSGGRKGVELAGEGKEILHVDVQELVVGDGPSWISKKPNGRCAVGDIAIGYYGMDGRVTDPDRVMVYNKGDSGLLLRAMILYG